jgi:hypothetical protein
MLKSELSPILESEIMSEESKIVPGTLSGFSAKETQILAAVGYYTDKEGGVSVWPPP